MIPTINQISNADIGIAQLYEYFQRPILLYLLRLVGERETAEDLCQETFLKALLHWESSDQFAHGSAWLYRIATNTAYDELRRRKRIRFLSLDAITELLDSSRTLEEHVMASMSVRDALAPLPPQYRFPLVLYVCGGHSTHEIATSLRCSDLAVRLRISRARARFKQAYQSGSS